MLQIIISPAKQMRCARDTFSPRGIPPFPNYTLRLFQALCTLERNEGPEGLQKLWRVNDKLLAENIDRLHEFIPVMSSTDLVDPEVARVLSPALFSYHGIQYQSMAPDVLGYRELSWLQDHLWVLSGFYGCVRPFDAVEPYRLEMAAKLSVDGARDLYAFWGTSIAQVISDASTHNSESPGHGHQPVIVNLASVEYAKAVLPHLPSGAQVSTCIFGEDLRNGRPVQRATASKIARGSMVRWMAEHDVEDVAQLTEFNVGYVFVPKLSSDRTGRTGVTERTLVFLREGC